jgi:SAM-dependent methyltransferase
VTNSPKWDPRGYERHAAFVAELGMPLVEILKPMPGERILDLGCGDGRLSKAVAESGCQVIGVDSSPEFVEAARARGLEAYVMDGHALEFDRAFDAVLSNAALHWMKRPDDVIAGVWRALKPGGRFAAELGGEGNVRAVVDALYRALRGRGVSPEPLNPWYFPGASEYRARLKARGFHVRHIALRPRPTPLPGDVTGWLETFAQSFTTALPPDERPSFLAEVRRELAPKLRDAEGGWLLDYVRLRLAAEKADGL